MELKKNPKADLEKLKSVFFLLGLLVALGGVLAAFTIASETEKISVVYNREQVDFDMDEIPITRQEEQKEVKPPEPKKVFEVLNIVDDDTENETLDEVFDSETDENEEIFFEEIKINSPKEKEVDIIYNFVSTPPSFPGGEKGLQLFIANQVKYPPAAREAGIEGKVYIRFCVNAQGKVEKVSLARGVDPLLDKEALRVVKMLPKWKPGENGGRKVSVWYFVPINFQLK